MSEYGMLNSNKENEYGMLNTECGSQNEDKDTDQQYRDELP